MPVHAANSNGSAWLDAQAAAQQRIYTRGILLSVVLHAAVGLAIAYAPEPDPIKRPEVISVRMIAMPPAPKAAPVPPAPKPVPAKPTPVPKKVILPKRAQSVTKKPKPKPKPLDYDDALAALRDELADEQPLLKPPEVPVGVEAENTTDEDVPPSTGELDPIAAVWMRAVDLHVRKSYVVVQDFREKFLRAELIAEIGPSGEVIGLPEITQSSGNPYYDDNVVRALLRASPLPPPPAPGDWEFGFSADD